MLIWLIASAALMAADFKTVCAVGCDYVNANIQSAIAAVTRPAIIELTAGESYPPITLTNKAGNGGYVIIRSSLAGRVGFRAGASTTASMATIIGDCPVVQTEKSASYWKLESIEVIATQGVSCPSGSAVSLSHVNGGNTDLNDVSECPDHIILNRVYVHGQNYAPNGPRNGIVANTRSFQLSHSTITNILDPNGESHALVGWMGLGPWYIEYNSMGAYSITSLIGGAAPNQAGVRIADTTFRGNIYYKPYIWRQQRGSVDPTGTCLYDSLGGEWWNNTAAGTYWQCQLGTWVSVLPGAYPQYGFSRQKNQFEYKNTSRGLVYGNKIVNAWLPTFGSQHGAAFLSNQVDGNDNGEWAARVEFTITKYNVVQRTPWGFSEGILYGTGVYHQLSHDQISHDNILQIGEAAYSNNDSTALQATLNRRVSFLHNTSIQDNPTQDTLIVSGGAVLGYDPIISYGIYTWGARGVYDNQGGGGSLWNACPGIWFPPFTLAYNVVINNQGVTLFGNPGPVNNLLTNSDIPPGDGSKCCATCAVPRYIDNGGVNDVGFVSYPTNLRLKNTSPYKAPWANDGLDAGANVDFAEWSTETADTGAPNPYLNMRVNATATGATTASVQYVAYDTTTHTVTVSASPDFSAPVFSAADSGGSVYRTVAVPGLVSGTHYYVRARRNAATQYYVRTDFYTR